jgi:signal transduction histidine kinase
LHSAGEEKHPVLIISSYNPDSKNTAETISAFVEEFGHLGGDAPMALENMNCKSFTEAHEWKGRMKGLLERYQGDRTPSLIVLIGQEAWAAYLSQNVHRRVPTMVSMASRNAIILPDDTIDLKKWMPQSIDYFNDFPQALLKAGFVNEYDVEANVRLIRTLYPQTKHIAFISDNSYGGVALQAHVIKEMERFPDLDLILLDGRNNTIYTITDRLHRLPPNTALLIGTWRVDMNNTYFMQNATYMMMGASMGIPTFSLTSVGIGYWAIGGIIPTYQPLGKEMARQAVNLLNNPEDRLVSIELVPNHLVMDSRQIEANNINTAVINRPIDFINLSPSFYEQYRYQIWFLGTVIFLLAIGLFISLYFFYHTKHLKDNLEISEHNLRAAKERAEESNRLKSNFLANMSHEIRTPLNAIVGFSDVLAFGGISQEEQQTYAEIIKANSDLLLRLINDILDISRLEANKINLIFENHDVVSVCIRTLASVEQASKKHNKFFFDCAHSSYSFLTDSQRLQQVIMNLLSNADKFTSQGIVTLKLEIDERRHQAIFSVSDTGCGIPPEKQEAVFGRFEKLNEFAQGTGLGLAICKLTVEKWGGKIWIDSDYKNGARFVFTHPLNLQNTLYPADSPLL